MLIKIQTPEITIETRELDWLDDHTFRVIDRLSGRSYRFFGVDRRTLMGQVHPAEVENAEMVELNFQKGDYCGRGTEEGYTDGQKQTTD